MKANKNSATICGIFIVILALLIGFFEYLGWRYEILIGIFTGIIVSIVLSIIGYWHERQKIVIGIQCTITNIYTNLFVFREKMGIYDARKHPIDLIRKHFEFISFLTNMNVEYVEKMNLEMYDGFYNCGKVPTGIARLFLYKQKVYNLKNSMDKLNIYAVSLNLDINNAEYNKHKMLNSLTEIQNIENKKQDLAIYIARVHEYGATLLLELDEIAYLFFDGKKYLKNWEEIKALSLKNMYSIFN